MGDDGSSIIPSGNPFTNLHYSMLPSGYTGVGFTDRRTQSERGAIRQSSSLGDAQLPIPGHKHSVTDRLYQPDRQHINHRPRRTVAQPAHTTMEFIDNAYNRHVPGNPTLDNPSTNPFVESSNSQSQTERPDNYVTAGPAVVQPAAEPCLQSTVMPGIVDRTEFESGITLESTESEPQQPTASSTNVKPAQDSNLLQALVDQFASIVNKVQDNSSANTHAGRRIELKLPRFDGSTDVHLFIKQFKAVVDLNAWDEHTALVQLRSCLEKGATDCGEPDDVKEVYQQLIAMYGISASEAKEKLHTVRKDNSESYIKFGNRVSKLSKLAYGGLGDEVQNQMALEHFDRALGDVALRQYLLVIRPRTLAEAVSATESFARVGRQPASQFKDAPARIAPMEAASGASSPNRTDELLETIKGMLAQQSERIAALEKQNTSKNARPSNNGSSVKGCWSCGGPHLKRNCPKLQEAQSGRALAKAKPENC